MNHSNKSVALLGKDCPRFASRSYAFGHTPENMSDCKFGMECNNPKCSRRHPKGYVRMCPFMNTPTGCTNLECTYRHPKGYVRMCPFMNTPTGCTNLKCSYSHPKGFVHACIFGANCKKHATGECPYLHPDVRGFVPQEHHHSRHDKPNQHGLVPHREAPPPPTPPRDVPPAPAKKSHPNKDEFGHSLVYDENGSVIGIIDGDHFISFTPDLPPPEVQEADREWDEEMNDFDPEHPDDDDDDDDDDEWESDFDEYPDHDHDDDDDDDDDDDEWECDPDAYP